MSPSISNKNKHLFGVLNTATKPSFGTDVQFIQIAASNVMAISISQDQTKFVYVSSTNTNISGTTTLYYWSNVSSTWTGSNISLGSAFMNSATMNSDGSRGAPTK